MKKVLADKWLFFVFLVVRSALLTSLSIDSFLILLKLLPWARKFLQTSEYSLIIISISFLFSCPRYLDPFFILVIRCLGLDLVLLGPGKTLCDQSLGNHNVLLCSPGFPVLLRVGPCWCFWCWVWLFRPPFTCSCCQGSSPWPQLRNCPWFSFSTQFLILSYFPC